MAETPHTPPGLPVVDGALKLGDDPIRYLTAVQEAYGGQYPLVQVDPLAGPTVNVILDPALVHDVLGDRDRFKRPNLGPQAQRRNGLLASDGALWEQQRSVLQPEFVGGRLASYADTTGDAVEALLAGWPEEGEIDLWSETSALAMQVIARTLFSYDVTRDQCDAIHEAMQDLGEEFAFSPLATVLPQSLQPGPSEAFEEANEAIDALASDIVAWNRGHEDPPRNMLGTLIEAKRDPSIELSDNELLDQTALFITGGHETTALTITYAFYWLSQRPDVRNRVRAEAQTVLDGDRPGWDDLPKLQLTERVIRETLRLTPAAWNITRAAQRPVRLGRYSLDEGELLLASPYAHGRDSGVWEAPTAFRPERWGPDGNATRARDSYFPFGSGPRSCIGRQLALTEAQFTLAHVLQAYDVEVLVDDLDFRPGVTLQPSGSIKARISTL